MKPNYLSIALATALATTLTACGSDNGSNYNHPTVAPAPQTKPDAGTKPQTPENKPQTPENKPQTPETKPEGDANKKPEGDANKKPDGDADADKKPEKQQPEKQEEGKKPQAPQPENKVTNPGNAANPGDISTDNFVVAQNYIRGAASSFDKTKNPDSDKIGNASVVGFNELKENPYMSNIVLARVTDGKKLTNIYVGEQADQVNNNDYKDDGTIENLEDATNGTGALQKLNDTQFITKYSHAYSDAYNAAYNAANIDQNNLSSTTEEKLKAADKNARRNYYQRIYQSGLVIATDNGKGKSFVRGQENPVIKEIKDGNFVITSSTGAPTDANANDVRMFGSLSQVNDVPVRRWNAITQKFEKNPAYKKDAQTQNSWQFDVEGRNNDIKNRVANNQTNQLSSDTVMLPNTLHLNHVQYGRVTANTDTNIIADLTKAYNKGDRYYQFVTTNKVNENNGQNVDQFNREDTTIDYYFARGLEPTKKMPTEGKINYLGHALTYGLDNSFHGGDKDKNNGNAVALNPRDAIGNFVAATLDTATKQVNGSIYNVWNVDTANLAKGVVKDNLVTFSGEVQGNTSSIVGTAKLAYTPAAGTPTDASFRGGFFGDNASELAGNINTTKEGYGKTAWGAVFGAKSLVAEPGLPIENQVEAQKSAAAATAETK